MTVKTLAPSQSLALPQPTAARRFDSVSWLTLVLALGLILFSIAQKTYRLTLPTDGWTFITGAVGSADEDRPTYQANLLGQPSPLRSGDRLLAVEGHLFESILAQAYAGQVQPLPNWHAGQTVKYTVERQDRSIILYVPLYSWTPGKILQQIVTSPNLWASTLLAVVGWFVFFKRPNDWAARALLLFNVCLLVVGISSAVVEWSLPELLTGSVFYLAVFFSSWIFAAVMFPSLLLLSLVFPQPKPFVRQHARLVLVLLYGLLPSLIIGFGPIATIGWLSVLVMALLSLAAMAHSFFTVRDPVGQAQMRWAVGGLVMMVLGFIPVNLVGLGWWPVAFPLWLETIWFPMLLMMVTLGFGVAILRYRLYDIDLIINRTLVYLPLTAILAGLMSASTSPIQKFVLAATGQQSEVATVLITLVIVAAFTPIKTGLQALVDRYFKEAPDPHKRLIAFGELVRTRVFTVAAPALTRRLLDEAVAAFAAEGGILYLDTNGAHLDTDAPPSASTMGSYTVGKWAGAAQLTAALENGDTRIGTIELGMRRKGTDYTPKDQEILQQVASLITQAIAEDYRSMTRG